MKRAALALAVLGCACSIPPEDRYVSLDATSDAGAPCTGPHLYEDPATGRCYEYAPGPLSWQAAESDCVVWGGHLVAIGDAAEQSFVANTIVNVEVDVDAGGGGVWIGLHKPANATAYEWSDGEPVVFTNWTQGSTKTRPCVFEYTAKTASGSMVANRWDDFQCSVLAAYVCER